MNRLRRGLLLFVGVAVLVGSAAAHDLGVARVRVEQLESGTYRVEAREDAVSELESPVFPERFRSAGAPTRRPLVGSSLHGFTYYTDGAPLGAGDELTLPWVRNGAFVRMITLDGRDVGAYFEATGEVVRVPIEVLLGSHRSLPGVLGHYLTLGIEHILMGWDHLAFVLCLCLIARGWQLAKLVTAFTVGHSLTLAAAVLGIAHIPIAPVEACIALSIAFVARDAVLRGRQSSHGAGLVCTFGLLHGLGFASALGESEIPRSELLPGLLAFNTGVEVGQLAVVFAALAVASLGLRLLPRLAGTGPVLARALGCAGMFWAIQRTVGIATASAS